MPQGQISNSGGSSDAFGNDRQRVLDATDLVRLISEHLSLKPKGREFVALCPFHDDHAPSMTVVPHKQIYHCFSCGAGGNALGFMMNYHKMSYFEALEHLAERAGIQLTPRRLFDRGVAQAGPGEVGAGASRAELLGASATAQTFFRAILEHPEHGKAAREVIERRGVSPEMARLFELGAAPDRWDGLMLTIQNKGMDAGAFRACGLLKPRESGGLYDAFRHRLIFPIHDQLGRVIAFGGRRLRDEDDPKYLNSAESPVFDKSKTLYALKQASAEIRRTRVAIVTEGYMDAIACHQAGVCNAVATLGTAMTEGNARVLKNLCDTVVLLFDGDEAGMKAARRAVEVFFAEPVDVKIATLSSVTDAKDPDELLKREGGAALLGKAIERAIDPLDLLFAGVSAEVKGQGLSARSRVIDEFVTRLVEMGLSKLDKVRYQLVVKRLAEIAQVDYQTIVGLIGDRARRRSASGPQAGADTGGDGHRLLTPAEHLLGCIMCDPSLTLSLGEEQWELIEPKGFADESSREVARLIADAIVNEQSASLRTVLQDAQDPAVQRAATRMGSEVERLTGGDATVLKRHWRDRLRDAALQAAGRGVAAGAAPLENMEAGADAGTDDAPAGSAGAVAASIEAIRKKRERFGHDPRAVPRPLS